MSASSNDCGIVEQIELQIDFGPIHIAQSDAARVGQFLVLPPDLLENPQGCRVIASPEMHLRNSAIGNRGPECHPMAFAVFFGDFEALHCFIEAIHFGQYIRPVEADRCDGQEVVGVFQRFLRPIVMARDSLYLFSR